MSKNSQFEVCSTVSLDINGSLAGILDFGGDIYCRKRAVIRVVFLRTMVAQKTRTVIIIRNPRSYQQFLHPSTEKGCIQGPHSHILMTGGPSDFLGLKFLAQSDFFWVYEIRRDFFGSQKKTEGFFGLRKKEQEIFLGMLKTVVIFVGRHILKL